MFSVSGKVQPNRRRYSIHRPCRTIRQQFLRRNDRHTPGVPSLNPPNQTIRYGRGVSWTSRQQWSCWAQNPPLVMRYTELNSKAVAERYLRLTEKTSAEGSVATDPARNYAIAHNRGGYGWTIQAAAFANIYLQMERALDFTCQIVVGCSQPPVAYCHLTDSMREAIPNPKCGSHSIMRTI